LCKRLAKEFFWFHKTNRLVIASCDVFFSCEKNKVLTQASFDSQDLITQNDLWKTLAQAKNQTSLGPQTKLGKKPRTRIDRVQFEEGFRMRKIYENFEAGNYGWGTEHTQARCRPSYSCTHATSPASTERIVPSL
jgi:hypothetical protein